MNGVDFNATVIQKMSITPGLIILRVTPDEGVPDFKPGQYTVLGLPSSCNRVFGSEPNQKTYEKEKMIKRAYSISSASIEKDYMEFYITLVRSGELTPRLFALETMSRIFIGKKPFGIFTLDKVPDDKNILFIGTGTGLAPYVSMIRSDMTLHQNRVFVILHGASCSWELGYRDELATLDRLTNVFHYLPTITEPEKDPSWNGLTGFIQPIITSGQLEKKVDMEFTPENFDVLLCGNPVMVDEVKKLLVEKGFTLDEKKVQGNVHAETYW